MYIIFLIINTVWFAGVSIGYPTSYSHSIGYSEDYPQYLPQLKWETAITYNYYYVHDGIQT